MVNAVEEYIAKYSNGVYDRTNFDKYAAKRKLILSCPVIHLAGSNGKSCTAKFLESIYLAANYKVASFIVPCLLENNECIRFNGKPIDDQTLAKLFQENQKDFDKFGLTGFEALVALAYRYFESVKPDIAIIECGMGGVLDATNLDDLDTRLSIITSISLEHTAELGTTVSQIALHTAGIIKADNPVLVGRIDDESLGIIRDEAKSMDAVLYRVDQYHFDHLVGNAFHFDYGMFKDVEINVEADYQLRNASLAIQAVQILKGDFPVSEEALRNGLKAMQIEGRLQREGRIVLDVAHNPEAIECLCRCMSSISKGRPVHVLFGSLRDKNIAVELPTLANRVADITLTTFDHPWAREEEDFFLYAGDHPYVDDAIGALKTLLEQFPGDAILITGATRFVGLMAKAIKEQGIA